MKALLVYPQFPRTLWSFERVLWMIGRKALFPPLGLATVAALLPADWEIKIVDRNVREIAPDDWAWADMVLLSAMTAQKEDFLALIAEAKRRSKPVAVGGVYPTTVPDDALRAGADYLVLDEGELTIPLFLDALARGEPSGVYRAEGRRAEMPQSPIPRYDLIELGDYDTASLQFSRGCPFKCGFCDIPTLFGRQSRSKEPQGLLAELDHLWNLGWRRWIFFTDDNFIGNRAATKQLLHALKDWQSAHGYPFIFATEASLNLAGDPELLTLMVECGFASVSVGIETPDQTTLEDIGKTQNTRRPLAEAVRILNQAGLRVNGFFIIGFDNDPPDVSERIVRFAEESGLPVLILSVLEALPGTRLWSDLEEAGRLIPHQTGPLNFKTLRPPEEIRASCIKTYRALYDPIPFLERVCAHFLSLGLEHLPTRPPSRPTLGDFRAAFLMCWYQGVVRETRWIFWPRLFAVARRSRALLPHYFNVCAYIEHFIDYQPVLPCRPESS
jgi:radical SAM superfamily enzyme YgiQ (UPF0313 family)